MRADNFETTYQDWKDSVNSAFTVMKNNNWTVAECTNWITDEFDDEMIGTTLAMWMIAIATKEIEMNVLENRVHDQICYYVPAFLRGEYDDDLREEEKVLMKKDVDYILSKVEMYEVEPVEDDDAPFFEQ